MTSAKVADSSPISSSPPDGQLRRSGGIGGNAAHRAMQTLQRGQQARHHQPHQQAGGQQ
ncbi:hypothetical protein ACTMU2_28790 [Cupriavidus basilensis]